MVRSVAIVALVVALVIAAPPAAHAVWFFDFDWRTDATFYTLLPDEVFISGTTTGHGVLALTRPPELAGGFSFEFSGTGGGGFGQTLEDGTTIVPGQIGVPRPPDVPLATGLGEGPSIGRLNLVGSPSNPSAISIRYGERTAQACLFSCGGIEFSGAGTRRAVTAPEPSATLIVALGLAAAVAARMPRRRGRALNVGYVAPRSRS